MRRLRKREITVGRFASETSVSRAQSLDEIERTLTRYGADGFAYGWEGSKAMVQFQAFGRRVRFLIDMPDRNDPEFTHTPSRGTERSPEAAVKAWEQAQRQRWRALALVVKAKLEAVETGITTFEEEFMAHIVLPNGRTVGQEALPMIAKTYETGKMQPLLPAPK